MQEQFCLKQEERDWSGTDRSNSRRCSETWEVFMTVAAPHRSNIERYMMMIGNSKFWDILKKEPYIFRRSRWTQGIMTWG
eukprot:3414650-Karenia_brevis.AAC.1